MALGLIVALALGVASSAALDPDAETLGSITTLSVVDGSVVIDRGGADVVPAHEGDVLAAGDTVRTGIGGSAEITYIDGSSVRLEGHDETVVESLRREPVGGTVSGAMQMLARAWHVVTTLTSGGSRYDVRVPSSTASVRG